MMLFMVYKNSRKSLFGNNNPHWKGGLVIKQCKECKKKVEVIRARIKTFRFCSKKCLAKYQSLIWRGENSPIWKGGSKASKERYYKKNNILKCITPRKKEFVKHV